MARKRPGMVAVRRIVAGLCLFLGLFVVFFGLGGGEQSLTVAGVAIMLLGLSVRVASSFRRSPREWVQGVGRVVDVSERPPDAEFGRCALQLVVHAPGLPQETVMVRDSRVPVQQWPLPGHQVPIQVAADDPRQVRVVWRDFAPVDTPLGAVWGDDQPGPAPGTPPGSHLDPSPVVDFDLDDVPDGKPLRPTRPAHVAPAGDRRHKPAHGASPEAAPSEHEHASPDDPPPDGRAELASVGAATQRETSAATTHTSAGAGADTVDAAASDTAAVPRPRLRSWSANGADGTDPPTPAGSAETPPADPTPGGAPLGVGVTLLVGDLGRSLSFYCGQLQFTEVDRGEDTAVLTRGQTRLVLRQAPDLGSVRHRVAHLNLEVHDIDARYEALRAEGVKFTYPPRPVQRTSRLRLWAAPFRDPDGHGVALAEWRPCDDSPPSSD